MSLLFDKYVPQEGFNTIFSDVKNCEIVSRPSEAGFDHQLFFLKKRYWLETDWTDLTLSWTIIWTTKFNNKWYLYTTAGNVYSFDGNTLSLISAWLTIDTTNYDENVIQVSYVWGGRYPNTSTEYTVSSYNSTTWVITFSETTLTTSFVGKYMYISSWGTGKYQQKYISACPANNQLTPSTVFQIAPVAWDKVQIYNSMEQQIMFPQIRKWTSDSDKTFVYTLDIYGNVYYRYFPEKRMLKNWDNRVVQLISNKTWLVFSSNADYEIPILTTVTFGNSRAINMDVYGWYLIVFFDNKVWLIKKDIIDSSTWTFAYLYQDLLDVGLYSRNSYLIQWGNLYIFGSDKRLYAVDISSVTLWDIIGKLDDQWQILINYFNDFDWGDVRLLYDDWIIKVIYRSTTSKTSIYKYYPWTKSRIVDNYPFNNNFHWSIFKSWSDKFTIKDNIICRFAWNTDMWTPIDQRIKLYWPVQWMFDQFTLILTKIRLWYAGRKIWWRINLTVGWLRKNEYSWDIESIDVVNEINSAVEADGTVWSNIIGEFMAWWENEYYNAWYFSEMLDISFRIGKRWTYFTIELVNDTEKDLTLWAIITYYNWDNPLVTYNKWVLSN